MRNRLIGIFLAILALAAAIVATTAGTFIRPKYSRNYQHMQGAGPSVSDHAGGGFASHLPLVLIETNGFMIEQDIKKPVMLSVIDNAGGGNRLTDAPAFTTASLINIRGKTSSMFPKKSYRLNFIENLASVQRKKHAVMGMPSESDWVLHGPCLDKSLMRNYLLYNLAGEIMAWAPDVRFCELFIDGAYEGLYVMTEAITVDKNRINVSRSETRQGAIGYLLFRDVEGHTKTAIESYGTYALKTSYELGIEYPTPLNMTPENLAYILRSVNTFEEKLYASQNEGGTRAFADEIDFYSFVDYFIFNEFAMNRDAGYFSTYAYRDPRGKLTMGPVWDFNNSFENHIDETPYDQLTMVKTNWFNVLVQDSIFVETIIWRYAQLRKSILHEDRLLSMIDDIAAYLGPAAERNTARWGVFIGERILIDRKDGIDCNSYTYAEGIAQLKNAIIMRGRFLDANLPALLRQNVTDTAHE